VILAKWEVTTTLLCGLITPLIAALLVAVAEYLAPLGRSDWDAATAGGLLPTYICNAPFAIVFGLVPALGGGAVYSTVLTRFPWLRIRALARAAVAALRPGRNAVSS
jgi:hypothetical protein